MAIRKTFTKERPYSSGIMATMIFMNISVKDGRTDGRADKAYRAAKTHIKTFNFKDVKN